MTQGQIAAYKDTLRQHGHADTEVIALFHPYVGETAEKAKAEAEQAVMNYVGLAGSLFPKKIKSEQYKAYAQFAPTMKTLTYDVLYNERTLIGDPDQVMAKLERFQHDLQMDQFISFLNWGGMAHELVMQSMERFAKYVLPHFQKADAQSGKTLAAL